MDQCKTVYETFFGPYIGKKIMIEDQGYYYHDEYIKGNVYIGKLAGVEYWSKGLLLRFDDGQGIGVGDSTKIMIFKD